MRFKPKFKFFFLILVILLYFSGLFFFILDNFFEIKNEFGISKNSYQQNVLIIHATAGLFFLFIFGYLYSWHINFRSTKRFYSGTTLFIITLILCISVPFLYYSNNEIIKKIAKLIHTYIGLISIFIILIHILFKKKYKKYIK